MVSFIQLRRRSSTYRNTIEGMISEIRAATTNDILDAVKMLKSEFSIAKVILVFQVSTPFFPRQRVDSDQPAGSYKCRKRGFRSGTN